MSPRATEVAFVIANDRHHVDAALPVVRALRERHEISSRVLSLAEFRGFDTPFERFRELGVPAESVLPFHFRRPSSGAAVAAGESHPARGRVRSALWHLLLAPATREALSPFPDLVVLPNDGAYPYDRIGRLLVELGVPFMVLQEGIRFSTPAGSREGRSAAAAWAVWGEASADFFRDLGATASRVHVTGSPRFDDLASGDWSAAAASARETLAGGKPIVAVLSNPIDDLGLVTKAEKLELIRSLAAAALPLIERRGWHLVIKLHGREPVREVESALQGVPGSAVSVVSETPLYPLLFACRAAMTFASSVGLEALLCGLPLAVLELPEHGFVHDFVASGAAVGISPREDLSGQLDSWLRSTEPRRAAAEEYLERHVAFRGASARRVADLIGELVSGAPAATR